MLLILLKETNGTPSAELPVALAQRYWGIGRTTAEKGLVELRNLDLLRSVDRYRTDDNVREGRRVASLNALTGPYSTMSRTKARGEASDRQPATAETNPTAGGTAETSPTSPSKSKFPSKSKGSIDDGGVSSKKNPVRVYNGGGAKQVHRNSAKAHTPNG